MIVATSLVAEACDGETLSVPAKTATRKSAVRMQLYAGLMLFDILALTAGMMAASILRTHKTLDDQVVHLLLVMLPLFGAVAVNSAAYGADILVHWRRGLHRALSSLILTSLIVLGVGFAWKISAEYSRTMILAGVAFSVVLITLGRAIGQGVVAHVLADGPIDEVMLCDGVPPPAGRAGRTIDARALGLEPRLDSPASLDRLGRLLGHSDRVLIACQPEARQAWTAALKGLGVDVEILIPEVEELGILATGRCGDALTAVVARGPLGLRQKLQKRAFDLVAVLWLMPVLVVVVGMVAVLIKLDDGGPVFFVQTRVGQGNRHFGMFKFRSMRSDVQDSDGRTSTARGDARITRVGRFLRITSLDELPQLFNVLRGDMSIVGPRPHALGSTAGDALFWAVDQRYWFRHAAKPGLTGLAQVRGFRGSTATEADLINRVQADLEYIAGWTLWRDCRIMLATMKVVLHPNAF